MTTEPTLGIVRHVLTYGGGFVVTSGSASSSEIEQGIGAVVTIIGVVWSILAKRAAAKTVAE